MAMLGGRLPLGNLQDNALSPQHQWYTWRHLGLNMLHQLKGQMPGCLVQQIWGPVQSSVTSKNIGMRRAKQGMDA